jgi:ribosome maturation factor RimP
VDQKTDELERLLASTCAALHVDLYDLEIRRGQLLVTVDRASGLDLDAVTEIARILSAALDEHEAVVPSEHYELEVSSPGLERKLRRSEHFRSAVGAEIALRLVAGVEGQRRFETTLLGADIDGIEIADGHVSRFVRYDEIERAHLIFDWKAALAASRGVEDSAEESDGALENDATDVLEEVVDTMEERA